MAVEASKNDRGNAKASEEDSRARARIGREVVYFSLLVIGVLGLSEIVATALVPIAEKERIVLMKDILTALLPVLGTWVATVLAFYFSKESFAAASQQASNIMHQLTPEQKLQEIAVTEVMISLTDKNTTKLTIDEKSEDKITLKAGILEALLIPYGKNRLPVVGVDGKAKYIIHRSLIDKFISESVIANSATKLDDLTLRALLDDKQGGPVATAFGTVGKNAKLNVVKALIDSNPDCSDVFVTEDGTRNGQAIGWITNIILAEKSRV